MEHVSFMITAMQDKTCELKDRVCFIWRFLTFLRLWRASLLCSNLDLNSHFISDQTYTDCNLLGEGLLHTMVFFSKHYPLIPFQPWTFGSDSCERFFASVRQFVKGKTNLSMMEIRDIADRLRKQEELTSETPIRDRHGRSKGSKYSQGSKRMYPLPVDMSRVIREQKDKAEKCTIQKLSSLNILDSLYTNGFISKRKNGSFFLTDENRENVLKSEESRNLTNSNDLGIPDIPTDNDGDGDDDHDDHHDDDDDDDYEYHTEATESEEPSLDNEISSDMNSNMSTDTENAENCLENDEERKLKGYIYVPSLDKYVHPAAAVSNIVGKTYTPSCSRRSRFFANTDKLADIYTHSPDDLNESISHVIKRGYYAAVWKRNIKSKDSDIIFGKVVRIMFQKGKSCHPLSSMVCNKRSPTRHFLYMIKANLNGNQLDTSQPRNYVLTSDNDILCIFKTNIVTSDQLNELEALAKQKRLKMEKDKKEEDENRRKLPEDKLKIEELKKYLSEFGITKGLSGKRKSHLVSELKKARGKQPVVQVTDCHSNYDGCSGKAKEAIYANIFTYEDSFSENACVSQTSCI